MSQPEGTQPQPNPTQGGYPPPNQPTDGQYPASGQYPAAPYPQPYPTAQYPQGGGYPPAGYPQQYGQAQQSPYGQAPYQPMGYPQQYPAQAAYPAAKPKKNPLLGIIALAVVVLSLVAALVAAQPIIAIMSTVVAISGTEIDQQYLTELINEQAAIPSAILSLSMTLGFAGWVTGIVATATNRGRGWGIFAFVLGILAPIIIIGVMVALLIPVMANI